MPTMPSGNHESLKSKIQNRKKARPNTPLSCKIQYYIIATFAYFLGRSAFFTDDDSQRNEGAVREKGHQDKPAARYQALMC
jgi:hypothetical protein